MNNWLRFLDPPPVQVLEDVTVIVIGSAVLLLIATSLKPELKKLKDFLWAGLVIYGLAATVYTFHAVPEFHPFWIVMAGLHVLLTLGAYLDLKKIRKEEKP